MAKYGQLMSKHKVNFIYNYDWLTVGREWWLLKSSWSWSVMMIKLALFMFCDDDKISIDHDLWWLS